jgi:indole-3-glycerol phosphate synthase
MPTRLDIILSAARARVASSKNAADLHALTAAAERHQPRGFKESLRKASRNGIAVIAELKKASPSKGLIRSDFPVAQLAAELEKSGAAALSVLTDEPFFQGSLGNLEKASNATRLPCLRKDFIVDDFQLLEARAYGADAVLLIVAALTQTELTNLHRGASEVGVDVLCEVHDGDELRLALDAGCRMIGVNNRDLRTFQVDLKTSLRLVELMPPDVLKVTESGIDSGQEIAKLRDAGYQAFLIGESLMRVERPGHALQEIMANAGATAVKQGLP